MRVAHGPSSRTSRAGDTGWGAPVLDSVALAAMPRLRAVLHAAGSVRGVISESCWERGLLVSSAAETNALPVTEFTVAAILLAGKDAFRFRANSRTGHRLPPGPAGLASLAVVGNFGRRVGTSGRP